MWCSSARTEAVKRSASLGHWPQFGPPVQAERRIDRPEPPRSRRSTFSSFSFLFFWFTGFSTGFPSRQAVRRNSGTFFYLSLFF